MNEYRNGNIELEYDEYPGDKLCELGFILLHSPHKYDFFVTRDYKKRITNKQKECNIILGMENQKDILQTNWMNPNLLNAYHVIVKYL